MTTRNKYKMTRFGQWNVRTLYQDGNFEQLSSECERLNIDLVGLSEVRWNCSGEAQSEKGGLLIYSGMPKDDDPHKHGVGIYLRKSIRSALICWKPISERIISARLRNKNKHTSVVQCYAPTEDSDLSEKENFYSLLDRTLNSIPKTDIIILMGDFNAQIGSDNIDYERIMGRQAIGTCNENGELFLEICNNHDLKIAGSVFPHKECHKVTWTSPRGNFESQIDHICISRDYFNICCDVRNKRSAEIGSDHYLIVAELRFNIWKKRVSFSSQRKFDTTKLHFQVFRNALSERLNNVNMNDIYDDITSSTSTVWTRIRTQFSNICKEVIGFKQKQSREWMSEDSWDLIEKRRNIKLQLLGATSNEERVNLTAQHSELSKCIKRQVKLDKNNFYSNLALAAQSAADLGNMRDLYKLTREISSSRSAHVKPIQDESGNLITSKDEQIAVWKRHFERTLSIVHDEDIEELNICRRLNTNRNINSDPPTTSEIRTAILALKNGKAAGCDGLPGELFKINPEVTSTLLQPLFQNIWLTEEIPSDWKESIIVKLPKKGNLSKCDNWRGISITPSVTKIFNRIILDRIAEPLNHLISANQAGFLPHRSCVDQINTLRILIEQSVEFNASLYISFVDFEKAFDALKREFIWSSLEARGIPLKIVNLIKSSYDGGACRVLHEGVLSEAFTTNSGVKQGCALSPLLFITALDIVFETVNQQKLGINWGFNNKLTDLAYADDVALLANRQEDMQTKITKLAEESRKVGLKINISKTKCMNIKTSGQRNFYVNDVPLEEVDDFEYLGSKVAVDGGAIADIKNRIRKARAAFAVLSNIWRSNNLHLKTKLLIFNSCVKTVLLYGCETWLVTALTTHMLQTFVNRCLRSIVRIWWPRLITNERLWEITNQREISKEIRQRKYGWLGHTLRKDTNDIAHAALTWNPQGNRSRGRPRTTWRRTIMNETSKSIGELRFMARDRVNWREYTYDLCR